MPCGQERKKKQYKRKYKKGGHNRIKKLKGGNKNMKTRVKGHLRKVPGKKKKIRVRGHMMKYKKYK